MSPQPTVFWYRDDEEVHDSERYEREHEATSGICHLKILRLEFIDQVSNYKHLST